MTSAQRPPVCGQVAAAGGGMQVGIGQGTPHCRQTWASAWISRARTAKAATSVLLFSANGQWYSPVDEQGMPSSGWFTTTQRSPARQAACVSRSSWAVSWAVWHAFDSVWEQPAEGLEGLGRGVAEPSEGSVVPHADCASITTSGAQRGTARIYAPPEP